MPTTMAQELQADARLAAAVRRAEDVFLRGIGKSKHPPRAVWRPAPTGSGSPAVELELIDGDQSATDRFAIEELEDTIGLRYRLSDLWGELIVHGTRGIAERLHELCREFEKSESGTLQEA